MKLVIDSYFKPNARYNHPKDCWCWTFRVLRRMFWHKMERVTRDHSNSKTETSFTKLTWKCWKKKIVLKCLTLVRLLRFPRTNVQFFHDNMFHLLSPNPTLYSSAEKEYSF